MKKVNFIVEVTNTGYSAYAEDFEKFPVATTGKTIKELTNNMAEALELFLDYANNKAAGMPEVSWEYDLKQFFEYYNVINVKALGERIGVNRSLISQYINGHKKAGPKQVERILKGVKGLGQELASLDLVG